MNAADPVVQIDGLVKHYGKVEAVRGIDLRVARGEVFGFLGPNGRARAPRSAACSGCYGPPRAGLAPLASIRPATGSRCGVGSPTYPAN
jgi:ABC-type multidrug transport system, ATPase component